MAIVQISKIQHRTGANIDLPQLDEGELGFSTDERKLFIGNDPILYPVEEGKTTTQLEILTEVSNLDHAKITGSANTELQITSPKIGQLLVLDGSSSTLVGNKWVNWSGNMLGNGASHSNNKLHLGHLANIQITGGMSGGVLSTDGTGNLFWTTVAGGGGAGSLPAQDNNDGNYLITNGTVATWNNVFADTNFATTVRSNVSVTDNGGDGSLSYSSSTGVITYTGPSASEARAHFSAGTGVSYDSANGKFSIAQDVGTESDVTFNVITVNNITDNGLYQEDDNGMALKGIVFNGTANTLQTNPGFHYDSSHNTLNVGKIVTVGNVTIGTTDIDGNPMIGYLGLGNITSGDTTKAPNDPGTAGQICWDTEYIYICTHQDTWEKIQIGATVTSGVTSYNDLTDKPTLFSGSYNDLTNKPSLFSGSYNDLTSKPSLFSGSYTDLTNKPSLFSGSYNDLTDKPTIPTAVSDLTGTPWTSEGYLTISGVDTEIDNKVTKTFIDNLGANANVANVANEVAVANVTGIGNIATINLTGDTGNVLYGNGVFAGLPNPPNLQIVLSAGATATSSVSIGTLTLTETGDSTSTTDGVLVVDGGIGVAKSIHVGGSVVINQGVDVLAVKGSNANIYFSVTSGDNSGSGIGILSKSAESGSGFYITDHDNSVSVLIGDSVDNEVANAVVKFTTALVEPSFDNAIDLGAAGAAWKSVTTRTATLDHDSGSLSLFANASGLFATDGTTTYQLNWTPVP